MTDAADRDIAGYEIRRTDDMVWRIHESFVPDFSEEYGEEFEAGSFAFAHTLIQKKSGRLTIAVSNARAGKGGVIVKQYWPKSWVERVKYCFRRSRAASEWRMSYILRRRGLPVPLALAWGSSRSCGLWRRSVLIVEAVRPGTRLRDYVRDHPHGGGRKGLAERLAAHVAAMHNAGFHHRDLHSENILIGGDQDGIPAVFFVDLHEVRRRHPIRSWMCVDDLGRLSGYVVVALRHRIAFLKTYLAERGIDPQEWKTWARRIDARTRQLWERHYRKRGERIDVY